MSDTALKTRSEKLTLTFMCFMLGSCRRSSLCCGVKRSLASAWMPYLSSVQWVLRSHVFFFSHHKAWSDQSFFTSTNRKRSRVRFDPVWLVICDAQISSTPLICIVPQCTEQLAWLFRIEAQIWVRWSENDECLCDTASVSGLLFPPWALWRGPSYWKAPIALRFCIIGTGRCSQCTSVLCQNETWTSCQLCVCAGSIMIEPSYTSLVSYIPHNVWT